jgi:hypothetical protein
MGAAAIPMLTAIGSLAGGAAALSQPGPTPPVIAPQGLAEPGVPGAGTLPKFQPPVSVTQPSMLPMPSSGGGSFESILRIMRGQ